VLDVLAEAAAWMIARGYENWPAQFPRALIAGNVDRAELYVVERDGVPVGTVTLQRQDEFFWGDAGTDGTAGYVHRLAVRRAHASADFGRRVLDWADEQIRAVGRAALRLDVVTGNRALRDYYEAAGFEHCRDVSGEFVTRAGVRKDWQTSLYERACVRPKS
jgi:GNAT superfamily N-acetyltransferase